MIQEAESSSSQQAVPFDEKFDHWPVRLSIKGTVLVFNDSDVASFVENAKRSDAFLGICLCDDGEEQKLRATFGELAEKLKFYPTFNEDAANALATGLSSAKVVLFFSQRQISEDGLTRLRNLKPALEKFLDAEGTVALDRQTGPIMSSAFQGPRGKLVDGLNLIPECVLQCGTESANPETSESRSEAAKVIAKSLAKRQREFGIRLEHGARLRIRDRQISCAGGNAVFHVNGNGPWESRTEVLLDREQAGRDYERAIFDLTQWRRIAIDHASDLFPPKKPRSPFVAKGTLLIVGGGGMPDGLMERMVELAGGKEARMVYVPCSQADDVGQRHRIVSQWKRMGVKSATFIHTKDRMKANSAEFYEPLKQATGIWFGGGRQWNFADSYYGTETHRWMKKVLARGGVIGGSSAGASIQARFLARATPVGNMRPMAPGYERGGLGFISGVAIDQHFTQRGRQKDMTQLKLRYPQLLGIGIDEATAIEVTQSKARVLGRGYVYFYGADSAANDQGKDYIALPQQSVFDLVKREVISKPKKD